jgi:sugar phosphate isomerase/epimerase
MTDQSCTYALNTSTIRDCGELSLPDKIAITGEAGYQGIEPWVREIDAYVTDGGTLADLRSRVADAGLQIVNLVGFFEWSVPDDDARNKGFAEAERCFAMAAELGCPYVAAPPMGIHTTPGVNLFDVARRYAVLVDLGTKFDVVPVLEYWGIAQTLGTLGEALMVAAESGRETACILADIFHTYKGSGQFNGFELIGPETVAILHVNDYPAQPPREAIKDSDRVYPGDGIAPYAEIVERLNGAGFQGVMSLELFNESYWKQDALTVARTGLEKLRNCLEK